LKNGSRALAFTGLVCLGLTIVTAGHASGVEVPTNPSPSEFGFRETPPKSGALGYYTVINDSTDWYISEFVVSNPLATPDREPQTTQPNWNDGICFGCFGGGLPGIPAFDYWSTDGLNLSWDIGPGQESSNFFFSVNPDSQVLFTVVNASGAFDTVIPSAPELSTWAMLIAGFGLLVWRYGQRQSRLNSQAASRHGRRETRIAERWLSDELRARRRP
jgi:hypothetical protein